MFFFTFILLVSRYICVKGETITYDGLGTFNDQPPWGGTDERSGNYLPSSPKSVDTRFYLDTRRRSDLEVFNTNMDNLKTTSFDPTKITKFIIHGYFTSGDADWVTLMSDTHLAKEDINSIRVHWAGGTQLNYFQSATDSQITGAEIGLFNSFGGNASLVHCIGHSLGAHACGYASNYLTSRGLGKFAQITGLDPAGPYFEGASEVVRLDSSDATFVQAIHTDAEKLINLGSGINQKSGHVDFWPNDGIDQPGCDQNILTTIWDPDGIVTGVQNIVVCNHQRAVDFYQESVLSSCPFYGYPCSSFVDYLDGKCTECEGSCMSMGYNAINSATILSDSWSTDLYLSTSSQKPFCEYLVNTEVHTTSKSDEVEGRLFLSLYGRDENSEQVQLSNDDVSLVLRPNRNYSFATHFKVFPESLDHVKLLWYQDEWTVTKRRLYVGTVSIFVGHLQQKMTFCGDEDVEMEPERRYQFNLC